MVNELNSMLENQDYGFDGKLLADVAHKIKNGLGGIGGFAALLERDIDGEDPRKRLVQRIQNGVYRVNEIVVSLMLLAQNLEPSFELSHIQLLLKDVWKSIVEENDGEIFRNAKLEIPAAKIDIPLDRHLFQKMLHYAIRFIDLLGGDIVKIGISPIVENKIAVTILFNNSILSQSSPEDILDTVNDGIPVEGRLCMALVWKIVHLHNANLFITPSVEDGSELKIELQTGNG